MVKRVGSCCAKPDWFLGLWSWFVGGMYKTLELQAREPGTWEGEFHGLFLGQNASRNLGRKDYTQEISKGARILPRTKQAAYVNLMAKTDCSACLLKTSVSLVPKEWTMRLERRRLSGCLLLMRTGGRSWCSQVKPTTPALSRLARILGPHCLTV